MQVLGLPLFLLSLALKFKGERLSREIERCVSEVEKMLNFCGDVTTRYCVCLMDKGRYIGVGEGLHVVKAGEVYNRQ